MADYRLTATDIVIRSFDGAAIPNDSLNIDRVEYDRWCASGGVPDPYTPPPRIIPESATKLGLMRALREIDLWDAVKAAIAAEADIQEEWDLAIEIKRNDPLTESLIAGLGLSAAQVDELIVRATELVA